MISLCYYHNTVLYFKCLRKCYFTCQRDCIDSMALHSNQINVLLSEHKEIIHSIGFGLCMVVDLSLRSTSLLSNTAVALFIDVLLIQIDIYLRIVSPIIKWCAQ